MNQTKQVTYEIALTGTKRLAGISEVLRALLVGSGFKEKDIVEYNDQRQVKVSVYSHQKNVFEKAKKQIRKLKLKSVSLKTKELQKKDWIEKWKEDFKPFALTRKFTVVPAWKKTSFKAKNKIPVYIDSSAAFGTGLHETTRFMVQMMVQQEGKFNSVCDVGTGTGILSIVGFHLGVNTIEAIDMNQDCVNTARHNLKENKCKFKKVAKMDIKDFKPGIKYDFVVANLITHVLIKNKRKIVSLVKPEKYLAISGIGIQNLSLIKKEFKKFPLRCLKIKKGRKWCALLYKRKRT